MHLNETDRTISLDLIKQAQLGEGNSRSVLSDLARGRIFVYIFRMTQNYHVSEDLCQETMVSLIQSIENLKFHNTNGFWAWLYRTALGKVQKHYRFQGNRRIIRDTTVDSDRLVEMTADDKTGGINHLIREELVRAISSAMAALKLNHRNIITLRCFDGLSYGEIARIRGSSRLQVKVQFFRAKQALKRQLNNSGFNQSHLLLGLALFAKVTAGKCGQAAASVTKACMLTSPMIAATAAITSKVGVAIVASAVVAGAVTNTVVNSQYHGPNQAYKTLMQDKSFSFPSFIAAENNPNNEGWICTYTVDPATHPNPSSPEQILIEKSYMYGHCLLLPEDHWVEVGFSGPILDGPGPDLFYAGWGCRSLRIMVTDGANQTYELPSITCINSPLDHHVVSFDLSGHQIGFEPRAVRIYGRRVTNEFNGFQLNTVKARLRQ